MELHGWWAVGLGIFTVKDPKLWTHGGLVQRLSFGYEMILRLTHQICNNVLRMVVIREKQKQI